MKKLLLVLTLIINNSWALEAVEPKKVMLFEEENCLIKGKEEEKCYGFLLSYDKSGIDFIDKILLSEKNEEEAKKDFIKEIEELKKELQEMEIASGAGLTSEANFLAQRGRFVQYATDFHSFAPGAAHGFDSTTYQIFDLEKKQQIHLKDIVIDGQDKVLKKLLVEALAEHFLYNNYYDDNDDYNNCLNKEQTNITECAIKHLVIDSQPLDENLFETADNFYFDKEGINFNFPPYAIAPYAYGSITPVIKWKKLKEIIKPEYLP